MRVECSCGEPIRRPGIVVAHFYREPDWPPNRWAPYQIKLDNDVLIYAPIDADVYIRCPDCRRATFAPDESTSSRDCL